MFPVLVPLEKKKVSKETESSQEIEWLLREKRDKIGMEKS